MGLFSKKNQEVNSELFTVEHEHQTKEKQGNTSRVNPAIHQEQHVPSINYSGSTHYSPAIYTGATQYFPSEYQEKNNSLSKLSDIEIVPYRNPLDGVLSYMVRNSGGDILYGPSGISIFGTSAISGNSGVSGSAGRSGTSSYVERPWWSTNPNLFNRSIDSNKEFRQSLRNEFQIDEDTFNTCSNLKQIDVDLLSKKRNEFPFGSGLDRHLNSMKINE